jgi:tetratricopeptide (TPR) repeat protein
MLEGSVQQNQQGSGATPRAPVQRLEGWKEIAEFFRRTVRTIQRWERDEELPIRRHLHASGATVYAYRSELADWRRLRASAETQGVGAPDASGEAATGHEAHTLYLMSRREWAQRTKESFRKSIALARTALQRNPEYAPAHAILALAHATRATQGYAPPDGDMALARESIVVALALDRNVVEAHQALSVIHLVFDWDWARARAALEEALRLNPSDAGTHQWFSLWHLARDEDDDACRMARRAEELDPTSLMIAAHSAWMLHYAGRMDEAIAKARSIIKRGPHFWRGYFNLSLSLDAIERQREAMQTIEIAEALNEHSSFVAIRAHALACAGDRQGARDLLSQLDATGQYVSPYWRAYAEAGLGEVDVALKHLDASVARREWFILFLKHEPAFAGFRSAAAFDMLRRKVGLP